METDLWAQKMGIFDPKFCVQETSMILIIVNKLPYMKILMMTFGDTSYITGTHIRPFSSKFQELSFLWCLANYFCWASPNRKTSAAIEHTVCPKQGQRTCCFPVSVGTDSPSCQCPHKLSTLCLKTKSCSPFTRSVSTPGGSKSSAGSRSSVSSIHSLTLPCHSAVSRSSEEVVREIVFL